MYNLQQWWSDSMVYYVVCDIGQKDMVLDSFLSRKAAERFIQTMQEWFALPLQIKDLLNVRDLIFDRNS